MAKFDKVFTLAELVEGEFFGLELDANNVEKIIGEGKARHEFYIGTDVAEWLSKFTAVTHDNLGEYFPTWDDEEEWDDTDTPNMSTALYFSDGDNSYNWSGNSSADINFNLVHDDAGRGFVYVAIHIGMDIRAGYTTGILLDLESYSDDDLLLYFLEPAFECSEGLDVEYKGDTYYVSGGILSEEVDVYRESDSESFYTWGCVYENDGKEAEAELIEIVARALGDD